MQARAADAGAGHECAPLASRQSGALHVVAHGEGAVLGRDHDLVAHAVSVLVGGLGVGEVGIAAVFATFQGAHLEAGLGELDAHQRAGPTEADHDYIDFVIGNVWHR